MNTAVAFIIFKRHGTAARVFEAIRAVRPPRLYVIADGARPDKPGEAEAVQKTRRIIDQVDWPCEIVRLFSETNLGCKARIVSGLTEVFSVERELIILEDDCLPHASFFNYCEALLERYRETEQVFHIGANQFHRPKLKRPHSYVFSKFPHVWGWASWARAWKEMDLELMHYHDAKAQANLSRYLVTDIEQSFWSDVFEKILNNPQASNSWDYPWTYSMWARGKVAANACVNLVENIGFGEEATHTFVGAWNLQRKARKLGKLIHPDEIALDTAADDYTFRCNYLLQEMRPSRRLVSQMRIHAGALRQRLLGKS